ncbi:MAG TPA: S1 RNA-binding domain-containing protein, partial [Allosphingosinicella sp.]
VSQIEAARRWIQGIVEEPEVGKVYTGKVVNLVDFGAFVNFMGGKDGLVHVSEIRNERVEKVSDALSEGQEVKVKVLEIDPRGKVRLSMRVVDQETGAELEDTRPPREGGDRDRGPRGGGDRGPRRDGEGRGDRGGGGRDRGPRRDGGGGGDRGPRDGGGDRGPRGEGGGDRGPRGEGGDRGPRREREDRPERNDGPEPEFAPAFLTRDDD